MNMLKSGSGKSQTPRTWFIFFMCVIFVITTFMFITSMVGLVDSFLSKSGGNSRIDDWSNIIVSAPIALGTFVWLYIQAKRLDF